MMRSCASAARLRGGGSILRFGTAAMGDNGSPPPRIGRGRAARHPDLDRATPGSRRGPQHEAGGDLAGGDHSPEGHQQLAGERHDQLLAQRLARVDDAFGAAPVPAGEFAVGLEARSEEHTSELQSLMRISYAVFCLTQKKNISSNHTYNHNHNIKT